MAGWLLEFGHVADGQPRPYATLADAPLLGHRQHLYDQQRQMHRTHTRRSDDRIVSVSQPLARPIIRGKKNKAGEFGSKLSVSLDGEGLTRVDYLSWYRCI